MIDIPVQSLFPAYIRADGSGKALAMALAAGMAYTEGCCRRGLDIVLDETLMPEWRLDEMAWELDCLYDYSASVAQKRKWIVSALPYFSAYGTPRALHNYLDGFFDSVTVEEGETPFHFTVAVTGELTAQNVTWLNRAVARAKNVRSVFDGLQLGSEGFLRIVGETDYTRYTFEKASEERKCDYREFA